MTDKKLKSHRVKIDKIDKEIYALIQKRASHAVAIGKIKSKVSPKESFYKPDRETKILRNILNTNKKFAAAAAAPIILNIVLIFSLLMSYYFNLDYAKQLSLSLIHI